MSALPYYRYYTTSYYVSSILKPCVGRVAKFRRKVIVHIMFALALASTSLLGSHPARPAISNQVASRRVSQISANIFEMLNPKKTYAAPCVMGDESIMSQKEHGQLQPHPKILDRVVGRSLRVFCLYVCAQAPPRSRFKRISDGAAMENLQTTSAISTGTRLMAQTHHDP